ncbi:MAG TPA: hypothetical protein VJ915_03405, partial [Balneolaceae bacterium]|nr:hypothetical protein [Balneolaceae bacterium]
WHLIDFANSITHNRGILTIATVLTSDNIAPLRQKNMEDNIRDFLSKRSIQGLVRVISAEDTFQGAEDLVKSYGLGTLVPNTIILGDSENEEIRDKYCEMIAHFHNQKRNTVIIHDNDENVFRNKKKIDLWWGGLKGNGGLMMILAYLLQSSRNWWDAKVTIKMMVPDERAAEDARENLQRITQKLRTGASTEIIVSNGRSFNEVLHESSKDADIIFMGMATPDENFSEYYQTVQERLEGLPTTVMVLAGEDISYGEVLLQQDEFDEN